MRENASPPRWDEEPVPEAGIGDLDRDSVARLIETARRRSRGVFRDTGETDALATLGVLVRHDDGLVPSLAGLLTTGQYPQQFQPRLNVTLAVYPHCVRGRTGPGGVRLLDSVSGDGPVPEMVADLIAAIQRNLRTISKNTGAARADRCEIRSDVLREAIINAVMHRDYAPYTRGSQVQVDLFPDRVEIANPAVLPAEVGLAGFGDRAPLRNPLLTALLQDACDPVTGRPMAKNGGTGLARMTDAFRRDTGTVPLFAASPGRFRVTLPRTSPVTPDDSAGAG